MGTFNMTPLVFDPFDYMLEYLGEMESQGKSKDYVRVTKNALVHFSDFLRAEGLVHPLEIERQHVIRFQAHINKNPDWSERYGQQLMKYIRCWINWCLALGYIKVNPWVHIKVGSTPKKPKPLEDDEINLLFATHRQGAFGLTPFSFHRREVILAILFGWGLRIHELQALNVANMDMRLDYVRCRNKGGGTKELPYTPEMKKIVARYLVNRAKNAQPGEDALLISTVGDRLTLNSISRIINDLGDKAGIPINPHRLRDSCGTFLLDSDVPAERVQKILGHANLKQTLSYSRVNDHKVKESLEDAMDPKLALLLGK